MIILQTDYKRIKTMKNFSTTNKAQVAGNHFCPVAAKIRLSGRTDKPKSEVMSIEEFERRLKKGTL